MIQDADAGALELVTQLTTMMVSTSRKEETRGVGGDAEVGVRSQRSSGVVPKETPKSKAKEGGGKGTRSTPRGGKQSQGVSTLSAAKTYGGGIGGIGSGGGGGGGGGGVQIPLSCGWRPCSDSDRNQSKELIQQVHQPIELHHPSTPYDTSTPRVTHSLTQSLTTYML